MDKDKFKKESSKINENDFDKVLENVKVLFETITKGHLKRVYKDVITLFNMFKDYYDGPYRDRISYASIIAIVFTLLYIINPFDIVPDIIPFAGLVDDFLCVVICLEIISKDINKYRKWKKK